jgi:hypothetical protein
MGAEVHITEVKRILIGLPDTFGLGMMGMWDSHNDEKT